MRPETVEAVREQLARDPEGTLSAEAVARALREQGHLVGDAAQFQPGDIGEKA